MEREKIIFTPETIEREAPSLEMFPESVIPSINPDNAECIDTRVFDIRNELNTISADRKVGEFHPVIITGELPRSDGAVGILQEKDLKRRQKELKEKSPKTYSEMLVCVNDLQLLRNTDDEAVGAFMKYLDANKKKITHFVMNGDIVDMEQANMFGSTPDQAGTMADEIASMNWFVTNVNKMLPDAKKVFIWGNHENRFYNYLSNQTNGIEEWVKEPKEVFGMGSDWEVIPYGQGRYYKWHDRVFWHGQRAGAKSHIAKLELQDAGVSVTTAHINKNQYHEERNALGELKSAFTHGGFSKDNLHFVKKANSNWSQGFGIYFWDKKVGEQVYSVVIKHGNPRFIDPTGEIFDGTGYNLREEIGLEAKRGRPRKALGK